jgi:pyrroline-5-carboxylate reductase
MAKIIMVGFGNMGRALSKDLFKRTGDTVLICETHSASSPEGVSTIQATHVKFLTPSDIPANHHVVSEHDVVILAVKPQNLVAAVQMWSPVWGSLAKPPLVVSILAGIPMAMIAPLFERNAPVIRAMPNIAAHVGESATVFCGNDHVTRAQTEFATSLFDSIGRCWVASESNLDAVTGLSGSGPAYIYMIIEALSDGGVKMGLPRQLSLDLAMQTVLGAAKHAQTSRLHPAVLKDLVTTPGGTTITALHELERHGLRSMLISAVVTATKRSKSLANRLVSKK